MSCATWREALSARLDGEDPPVGAEDVDAHLAACSDCAAHAADLAALHRATRLRPAEAVPDRTEAILAAVDVPAPTGSRRRARWGVAAAIVVPLVLAAGVLAWTVSRPGPGHAPPALRLASGFATAAPTGGSATVYLSITNDGGPDDLVGAEATVAERASLHASEHRDGYVLMTGRADYPVPAEGTIAFQPGGAHLMLEGLDRPLQDGDRVTITLLFSRAAPLEVTATVVPLADIVDLVGWDPSTPTT